MDTPRRTHETLRDGRLRDPRSALLPIAIAEPFSFTRSPALFPNHYAWLLLVGALDVMLTYVVLRLGGIELNGLAARAIESAGHWGLVAIKFSAAAVVVLLCEAVGRRQRLSGRRLSEWAIAIWSFPVVVALVQLALFEGHIPHP
ncbi:MAG: DUF5658 family protein [Phycisphaerales bacterium]